MLSSVHPRSVFATLRDNAHDLPLSLASGPSPACRVYKPLTAALLLSNGLSSSPVSLAVTRPSSRMRLWSER